MKASSFVAMVALTVSACCGPLPDLPEVAFGPGDEAAVSENTNRRDRKAMSLEEAVGDLRIFHEKVVEEAAEGLCVAEVTAAFEVMTVKGKGASVALAVVPLSLRRGRQRAATAGSTVTVTYRNPECAPVEVEAPESTAAEAPAEEEEEAGEEEEAA